MIISEADEQKGPEENVTQRPTILEQTEANFWLQQAKQICSRSEAFTRSMEPKLQEQLPPA